MRDTDEFLYDAPPEKRCPVHGCFFERGHDPEHGHGSDTCDDCGEPHGDEECPPKRFRQFKNWCDHPSMKPGWYDCPPDCECKTEAPSPEGQPAGSGEE